MKEINSKLIKGFWNGNICSIEPFFPDAMIR